MGLGPSQSAMVDDVLPGGCALIPLAIKGDERGSLIAIEQCRDVPFELARVYYLFGTVQGVTRGLHAHRELHQFAIAVSGSCNMLLDDGSELAHFVTGQSEGWSEHRSS